MSKKSHQTVICAVQAIMLKTTELGVKRCGPRTSPSASATRNLETKPRCRTFDSHRTRLYEFKRSEIRTDFFSKEEKQEGRRRITIDDAEFPVKSAEPLGGCVP